VLITVKAARVNVGMTQRAAAQALGISLNGYAIKERGQGKFYAHELAKLSQLYGVGLLNFFEAGCHDKTQPGGRGLKYDTSGA
jgi:transcriptional regulator with XRE-family HTH domain